MKNKDPKANPLIEQEGDENKKDFPGYPLYPDRDDIYGNNEEAEDVDPEQISKKKSPNEKEGTSNENNLHHDLSGNDLDIPGVELDDERESLGNEDEENNAYSLGGDDHDD